MNIQHTIETSYVTTITGHCAKCQDAFKYVFRSDKPIEVTKDLLCRDCHSAKFTLHLD